MGQGSAQAKIPSPILVLTSVVLSILAIQIIIALGAVMEALARGGATVEDIVNVSAYSIGIGGFLWTYWISSTVASYFLYRAISQHMLEHMRAELCAQEGQHKGPGPYPTHLPSPVTALVLSLLTGGLAYTPLFFIADKVIREHIGERGAAGKVILQVGLFFGTLTLSMIYESYNIARKFNYHSHPREEGAPGPLPLYVIAISMGIIALHLAFTLVARAPLSGLTNVSLGLCWAAFNYELRELPARKRALANLLFAYLVILGGFLSGLLLGSIYESAVRRALEYLKGLRDITYGEDIGRAFLATMAAIFWNNFSISIGGAIPYLGSIPLANGIGNAGIILGSLSGMLGNDMWLVFFYPHSVLELIAYAIFVTAAPSYREPRAFLKIFAIGTIVLAIAALVETLQIFLFPL